ncbi:type I polyketide synthase [Salinispora cortesiana]|uniref:type I polyketide synthase n=1 Tax=Salinispora cortesiana TaxID=1305843 RepID=UPI0004715E98|nr:type I polyketide synthase [Salinispora cortesiana]
MRSELIRPLSELLGGHAVQRGDKIAFADGKRGVSYTDLDRRTARLAGHLAALGLATGGRAVILMGNSVEAVESCLAVIRAGGIAVPLNPQSSAAEIDHLLDDAEPTVIVCDPARFDQVSRRHHPGQPPRIIRTGEAEAAEHAAAGTVGYEELMGAELSGPAPDEAPLDAPAWMLYTSGTTGRPKGVLYSLRSSLWLVAAGHAPVLGLSEQDHLLWPMPLFHGLGQNLCVLGVTAVGASARLMSGFAPSEVRDLLREEAITFLAGVPTTYHYLLDQGTDATTDLSALRLGFVAGSASGAALGSRFEEAFGVPLVDQYGSSETGAITSNRPFGERVPGSVGPPLPGVDIRLVDPDTDQEVPTGKEGEVWVAGPNLMLGYHRQPDATAAVLRDGWYRTGDLGRRDARGHLTLTGRRKELIIRGGENIHPAEVEEVLRAVAGVADVAVGAEPHDVLGEVPVAYLVPGPEGVDTAAVFARCRRLLSFFKVPEKLYAIDRVPRTSTGKITRHLLAEASPQLLGVATPDGTADGTADGAGPIDGTALAAQLREMPPSERTRNVLELVRSEVARTVGLDTAEQIRPDQPFVDLGLGSLAVVGVGQRLCARVGLRLPATVVFDHPTPTALTARLVAEVSGTNAPAERTATPERAGWTNADEPIAIVAMACRFPGGVEDPDQLWTLIAEGRDATSELPEDRNWPLDTLIDPNPDHLGTSYVARGGFLADPAGFDAAFFGISPREATAMDPQQRILLEIAWEAFERAGIDPTRVAGSPTGLFIGTKGQTYSSLAAPASEYEGYLGFATSGSVLSGRVAYTLGLEGPAITVDTACSASLVALHLACQSLHSGESRLALAGGVTVMATPDDLITFSRQRGLAADGRVKAFAAAADGTAFGEGAGVVLLERLSDARRAGRKVLAVIRGSAVNQDGTSNGLTAPNGQAQQRLIRQALAAAQLGPADIDLVEAHGTGTALGDPIEAEAILATYGQGRAPDQPVWLGSVKSNITHTQAAAGAAGLIKIVQAMRHRTLPATLNVDQPSPHVDWASGQVRLATEPQPWQVAGRPRRAGISAFGISGTNAHVVVEESPVEAPVSASVAESRSPAVVPWLLSAKSPVALRTQAARLATMTRSAPEFSPVAVGRALARSRAGLEHRATVVGTETKQLLAGLEALAADTPAAGLTMARAVPGRAVAALFTGQGAQYQGMGRHLYDSFDVFADKLDEVCRYLTPEVRSALLTPAGTTDDEAIHQTGLAQPALFALGVAQFALLRSWGVHPSVLVGHSIGELTAAHVAGVLSLPDAAHLVNARGALMQALPPGGAMLAVKATEEELLPLLAGAQARIGVAAVNAPRSVVVSGDEEAVTALATRLAEHGVRATRLRVSHAFHSAHMDPVLDDFRAVAKSLTYQRPAIPIVSTVTGATAGPELLTPEYWVGQLRQPVRFAPAVHAIRTQGTDTFVELGPDGVLTVLVREILGAEEHHAVPLCRRSRSGAEVAALGALHALGVPVEWEGFFPPAGEPEVDLPTYPFQRRRYWLPPAAVPPPTSPAPRELVGGGDSPRRPAATRRSTDTVPSAGAAPAADGMQVAGGAMLAARLGALSEEEQFLHLVRTVQTLVAAVLGHADPDELDPDESLLDLGFDSLTAVELRNQIRDLSGVNLPASLVFEYPTVAVLADHLLSRVLHAADDDADRVDFAAEVTLAADIVCADEVVTAATEPREVLLTGATGFLGAFLLRDLMRSTNAVVHCLVRSTDEKPALDRLRDNLQWYQLWDEIDPNRLSVVVGDLATPGFGLSEQRYDELSRRIDAVYHAAATVNSLYPYSSLKAANVTGTEEILRLAARHRSVPVHHVSSTGVFSAEVVPGVALKSTDPPGPAAALSSGYRQTKLVAEQIIDIARERGLPVSIYRIDEISGDSELGRCQRHDFVWLSMKGILQAEAVPADPAGIFHLVPVDYVSSAILRLSRNPAAVNRNHHLANGTHLPFVEMMETLRARGYRLDEFGWDPWVRRVRSNPENTMVAMVDGFESTIYSGRNHYLTVDTSETRALLAGTGIDCPPMTQDLFEKYVDFFVRVGYFPPPGAHPATASAGGRLHIRPATTADLPRLAQICYQAFEDTNASLGLPPEWSSEQAVLEMLQGRLASPSCVSEVAVDATGSVVGSNFLVLGEEVAAIGPLSVAPDTQGGGVGRKLMESMIAASDRLGWPSVRGVQVTNNTWGYRLYSSLGFVPQEQLSLMVGYAPPTPGNMAGFEVRPMTEADVPSCQTLYRKVNGHSRDSEIHMAAKRAFEWSMPYVVLDKTNGELAGYTTGLADLGHLTATSEAAARALYAGAGELMRRQDPHGLAPRLRIPGRLAPDLLSWAARTRGVSLLRLETLISLGSYTPPEGGVYCPGLSY